MEWLGWRGLDRYDRATERRETPPSRSALDPWRGSNAAVGALKCLSASAVSSTRWLPMSCSTSSSSRSFACTGLTAIPWNATKPTDREVFMQTRINGINLAFNDHGTDAPLWHYTLDQAATMSEPCWIITRSAKRSLSDSRWVGTFCLRSIGSMPTA